MRTGLLFLPTTQAPSHRRSCGQSRPHISGMVLVSWNTSAAPITSPFSSFQKAPGMSFPTGHATWQGAAGHWMQRSA